MLNNMYILVAVSIEVCGSFCKDFEPKINRMVKVFHASSSD